MTSNDEDRKPLEGEVLPARETHSPKRGHLPTIHLPESGSFLRIAFWNTLRFEGARRQIKSYTAAIKAYANALGAASGLMEAQKEHYRAQQELEHDLDNILDADRRRAKHEYESTKRDLEIQTQLKKKELLDAKAARFRAEKKLENAKAGKSAMTEPQGGRDAIAGAMRDIKEQRQTPTEEEEQIQVEIDELLGKPGGEENLSEEDQRRLAAYRELQGKIRGRRYL